MAERIKFRMVQSGDKGEFELFVDGRLVATGLKIAEDMHPLFLQISSCFRYWLPQRDEASPALMG
jgi:hypothetical protein